MKTTEIVLIVVVAVVAILLFTQRCQPAKDCKKCAEDYEPQNMGSRRYWGFGRENAYSVDDHQENHGPCYPASLREYRPCVAGYSLYTNKQTGRLECCVNASNH